MVKLVKYITMKKQIPENTINRLSAYYRMLIYLAQRGTRVISSKSLANILGMKDSQVRKDLSYFGRFGVRGEGYQVALLSQKILHILGLEKGRRVCIIGMGNLGSALAAYKGFSDFGFEIRAVFDSNPGKIGKNIRGYHCYPAAEIKSMVKKERIELAILTVPIEQAQVVANRAVEAGIKAILNFAPVRLSVPPQIRVDNVDLAMELKKLSYFAGK